MGHARLSSGSPTTKLFIYASPWQLIRQFPALKTGLFSELSSLCKWRGIWTESEPDLDLSAKSLHAWGALDHSRPHCAHRCRHQVGNRLGRNTWLDETGGRKCMVQWYEALGKNIRKIQSRGYVRRYVRKHLGF